MGKTVTAEDIVSTLAELVASVEDIEQHGGHVTYIMATSGFYTEVRNLVREYRKQPGEFRDPYKKRLSDIAELSRTLTWDDQSCEQKNCREAHNCAMMQVHTLAVSPVEESL